MTKPAPDYTVADNTHCLLHCGPLGPESKDDGRDLTIMTSGGNHVVYGKNGNKVEHIQGTYRETSGHNLDPEQRDNPARTICAANGDIDLVAKNGNIRLTAKNIYFVTSGEDGQGNFIVNSNGQVTLSTGGELRLAAGTMCFTAAKSININSTLRISGKVFKGSAISSMSTLRALLAGNWSQLLTNLTQTCK
jgi:hypothetical protein